MFDWICNICDAKLFTANSLWSHYNSEHVQYKYICTICTNEYRGKSSFNVHWEQEHKHDNPHNVNNRYFERRIELVRSNRELKHFVSISISYRFQTNSTNDAVPKLFSKIPSDEPKRGSRSNKRQFIRDPIRGFVRYPFVSDTERPSQRDAAGFSRTAGRQFTRAPDGSITRTSTSISRSVERQFTHDRDRANHRESAESNRSTGNPFAREQISGNECESAMTHRSVELRFRRDSELQSSQYSSSRAQMRGNDRETIVSSTERHGSRDPEHPIGYETSQVSQSSMQYQCVNDRESTGRQLRRDPNGANEPNLTEARIDVIQTKLKILRRQSRSERPSETVGQRYDPYKMALVEHKAVGTPKMECERRPEPKVEQALATTSTNANQDEFKKYLKYYKGLRTGHFDCPICENRLTTRQSLLKHMVTMHGNRERPEYLEPFSRFISKKLIAHVKAKNCAVCGSQCESIEQIISHLSKRHGVEVHVCSIPDCAKVYLHKKNLEKHALKEHHMYVSLCFHACSLFTFRFYW